MLGGAPGALFVLFPKMLPITLFAHPGPQIVQFDATNDPESTFYCTDLKSDFEIFLTLTVALKNVLCAFGALIVLHSPIDIDTGNDPKKFSLHLRRIDFLTFAH